MSDTTYCDAYASEDPRFDYGNWDTFAPPPGTWAPDCGHEACVEDESRCPGFHDWDCPVATCRWNAARTGCDFPANHSGDHSYALPAQEQTS